MAKSNDGASAQERAAAQTEVAARKSRPARIARNVRLTLGLAWAAAPRQMAFVIALTAVAAVIGPLSLLATARLLDAIAGHPSSWRDAVVLAPVVALGVLAVANAAVQTLTRRLNDVFADRVWMKAHKEFLAHVAASDLALLDDPAWHDKLTRARADVGWRPHSLTTTLIHILSSTITLASLCSALFFLDPPLVWLALLSVIPAGLLRLQTNQKLYDFFWKSTRREREHDYLAQVASVPYYAKDVRAFGLAKHVVERAKSLSLSRLEDKRKLYLSANTRDLIGSVMNAAVLLVAYVVIVDDGTKGTLSIGSIAAILGAFTSVAANLGAMIGSLIEVDQHAQFLDDYFSFLAIAPKIAAPAQPKAVPSPLRRVVLEGISFRYPTPNEEKHEGLVDVDLEVRAGQVVALVGENGAGKSTLVKLLLRFFDPTTGSVKVAGDDGVLVDSRELDPIALRSRIGVLFQDYGAYELEVKDVMHFGRVEVPLDEARALSALDAARARGIIDEIGHGLSAVVGRLFEGGHDLSGGQWQRLALARLIYRDADLWILDEPTANLDPAAEAEIFEELRLHLRGRMGIVISHRFSTVRTADQILVLAGGRIVERGTHDELLLKRGKYAEMFETQASGYR